MLFISLNLDFQHAFIPQMFSNDLLCIMTDVFFPVEACYHIVKICGSYWKVKE